MEIQLKVMSCCKFLMYLVGVNHKIYSRHIVNDVFTLTQLLIKILQHNIRYTCWQIKDYDFER